MSTLWTLDVMATAMHAGRAGYVARRTFPVFQSIAARSEKAMRFSPFRARTRDGHDFVDGALKAGAGLAVVARGQEQRFSGAPLLIVPDVLEALRILRARLAPAARTRHCCNRLGWQDRHQGCATARAFGDGETHASVSSYNNHWGVPLSLARCSESAKYAVFEIGMNHAGEITPLTKLVRPQVAIITTIEPVHLEYFGSLEKIADAKAEIFTGVEAGGAAVLNRDNGQYERLAAAAKATGVGRIVSFGAHEGADAQLLRASLQADSSTIEARILGQAVTYRLGAPGRHLVLNSLAVLAAASLVGADLALAALALNNLKPASGRGARPY